MKPPWSPHWDLQLKHDERWMNDGGLKKQWSTGTTKKYKEIQLKSRKELIGRDIGDRTSEQWRGRWREKDGRNGEEEWLWEWEGKKERAVPRRSRGQEWTQRSCPLGGFPGGTNDRLELEIYISVQIYEWKRRAPDWSHSETQSDCSRPFNDHGNRKLMQQLIYSVCIR